MYLNFFAGTAAELIKLYPVIQLARARGHEVRIIASGQSPEGFRMQYRDLGLPETQLIFLSDGGEDLRRTASAIRWFLRAVLLRKEVFASRLLNGSPGYLVIHGDTLSTLAGAWLGYRTNQTIVHIEAGLRSNKLTDPFPEEIIRRIVSRFVHIHMAPDDSAAKRLRHLQPRSRIVNTSGNTLMDAIYHHAPGAEGPREPYVLVNIHRYENLRSPARWRTILATIEKARTKMKVIFVAHPQTKRKIERDPGCKLLLKTARMEIRDRLPFTEFIALLKGARFVISDGGSNQEECSYLAKPCLLMRRHTERSEGLAGVCILSRFDATVIDQFLENPPQPRPSGAPSPASRPSLNLLEALERHCDSPA